MTPSAGRVTATLDTVFVLGSLAADRGPLRWTFGLGAVLAGHRRSLPRSSGPLRLA